MKTKENVRSGKITAQEAYDKLFLLVGEQFADELPTLVWLKNLIGGRKIQPKQENKEAFKKRN
ncbi:hypothetical protein EBU71_13825 [bacterium]|nr:hypothetical protein [Candidatus Elulimicrobium humile]